MARILVVEDDLTFLELLRAHLSRAGHVVQVAEDAAVALRSVLADPPELILLDLNVPYLHGFEILQALRADPMTHALPIIVVTGHDDDETYVQAQGIGIDGYFTKPIQREQLMQAVEAGLSARKPAD